MSNTTHTVTGHLTVVITTDDDDIKTVHTFPGLLSEDDAVDAVARSISTDDDQWTGDDVKLFMRPEVWPLTVVVEVPGR